MEDTILVTNIQRFSLHDGPGIRTTVFCKGCPLRCPWCSNPENQEGDIQRYEKDGSQGVYGKWMSCDELYTELIKDRLFYKQMGSGPNGSPMPGGVTFSGGEPLIQSRRMEPLMQRLADSGIHMCVETCLFVPKKDLQRAIKYIDLFYADIKLLGEEDCADILHGRLGQYLTNLEVLSSAGSQVVFRVPVIGGYTDGETNRRAVAKLIERYPPIRVELIKEHNLGQSKYRSLGRKPLTLNSITDEFMEIYRQEIEQHTGIPVQICIA